MANIWTENRSLNNENSQYAPLRAKQAFTNGSRSAKKLTAFSEIKNVMHDQIYATPLRGNAAKIDGLPNTFGVSKSLCNEVLRKQQMKQTLANAHNKLKERKKITKTTENYKEPVFDEGFFDSWDIDRDCCKQQKSEAEIWSEMDMLDMDFTDFKIDSSLVDEDLEKDLLEFIPELESIPVIPDIDPIEPESGHDFEIPTLNIQDFDQFNDELPF